MIEMDYRITFANMRLFYFKKSNNNTEKAVYTILYI